MGDLGEHGVRQVLHHQAHAVGPRPAQAEEGLGLGLARLQGDAVPPQAPAEAHQLPVVGALVHEQGLAGRHAVDVDAVGLQVVREGLLHVEDHAVEPGVLVPQPVEDPVDVGRLGDRAVEVGRQPVDAVVDTDLADPDEAPVVPGLVGAAQLHLQALEPVAADPVGQQHRVAVVGLVPGQLVRRQRVEAAHEVPGGQPPERPGGEEVPRVEAGEVDARIRLEEAGQVGVEVPGVVGLVDRAPAEAAEGVVEGQVEGGAAHPRRQQRHLEGIAAELLQDRRQPELEGVPHLEGVSPDLEAAPGGDQPGGEGDQGLVALLVGLLGGPDPLHAQGRLPPPCGSAAVGGNHLQADPGHGDAGGGLRAELQRHPGLHRQEVEGRAGDPHVGRPGRHPSGPASARISLACSSWRSTAAGPVPPSRLRRFRLASRSSRPRARSSKSGW